MERPFAAAAVPVAHLSLLLCCFCICKTASSYENAVMYLDAFVQAP
jgi:hypothetical protein